MSVLEAGFRKIIRRAGFDVVRVGDRCSRVFNALWALLPDTDLVIDVGANRGQFRDKLRGEMGYAGRIVSFEPSPPEYAHCKARAESDPAWDVYPWGLGSVNASLTLNVAAHSDMSSFRPLANPDDPWASAKVVDTVEVPVKRLDDVAAEIGIEGCRKILLKADTQGYDLEVFRGAPETLKRCRAMLSEVAQVAIYDEVPDFLAAIAEMRGYGFDVCAISPITSVSWAVVEWDCLLVRQGEPT